MKRTIIVFVLIIALIGSGLTRHWADAVRGEPVVAANSSGGSLSGMNSYALALLLGGLRGPLVMFLWSSSESQKADNDLEDFDSKVEWIRLLQPEFDSVHIFQIWNKAYNISVKMTNLANKYSTILDALDYAQDVNAEKPNDINIVSAIGGIYFDKFGSSTEKFYYRTRVRAESMQHNQAVSGKKRDASVRRTELDPILDAHFNILPELTAPKLSQPLIDPANPENRYDGSDLQFLPQYQPYPYGVSPFALAYAYERRGQLLQLIGQQRHAQLSDLVIDSRPPLALRGWADEETEFGRRAELTGFGSTVTPNAERMDFETTSAATPISTKIVDRKAIDEAIFEYARAAVLYQRADYEFGQHILRYKQSEQTYLSHRAEALARAALAKADHDYLAAAIAAPADRPPLLAAAAAEYRQAANLHRVIILRFCIWDQVAERLFPPGVTRQNVTADLPQLATLTDQAIAMMEQLTSKASFVDDAGDYLKLIERATIRLKTLEQPAATQPQ